MENGARISWPAWGCSRRPPRPLCTACFIIVTLAYPLVIANVAEGATYYLDAVSGNDSNPGTSDQPWKTLSRAYTSYSGESPKVQQGDTVLFRSGSYGQFRESTGDNPGENWLFYRNNWVTYKTAPGQTPILTRIDIDNQDKWGDINHGDSYLIFDGFTVADGVSISYTSYVKVLNCNVRRQPAPVEGYYAPYFVTQSCAISGRDSHHITIQGNDVSDSYRGIRVWGSDWLVKNNTIHHIAEDGAVIVGDDATIEGNLIYGHRPYGTAHDIYGTKTGTFIDGEAVTMTGTDAEGIVHNYSGTYLRVYPTTQNTFHKYWLENRNRTVVGAESGAEIVITDTVGKVDPPHTDSIQVDLGTGGTMTGLVIRNNILDRRRLAGTDGIRDGQGLKVCAASSNSISCTIESNLINAGNYSLMQGLNDANICNNTFYGVNGPRFMCTTGNTTINNMYNNLIERLYVEDAAGGYYVKIKNHGNNIFNTNPTGQSADYPFVLDSTEAVSSTFAGLFTDPSGDPGDFTLSSGSAAIDFGNAAYGPTTDRDGNARVGAPDAGCYEHVSSESGNHAPVLESIGDKTVSENALLTFTLSATDADGDTITYSATGLPTGATLSGRTFTWTPGYTQAGTYDLTFVAGDGTDQDSEIATVTVNNVNRAPVLAAIDNQSINEGSLLSFSLSATDADGDGVTYTASSLPAGSAFAGSTFAWVAGYTQAGTFEVTFTANDGQATDSQAVTITVNNVNRAPVLDAVTDKSVNETTLLTFRVNATDPDGDAIGYLATGLPGGATFTGQTFNWTPAHSQADGSYDVTFTAGDGTLDDSQVVTITVSDTSAPTVANCSPPAESIQAPLNNLITLHVTDDGKGVDAGTVTITLDGGAIYSGNTSNYVSATGNCRRTGTKTDYAYAYQSGQNFDFDQTKTVTVNATDLAGNVMSQQSYSFRTEMRSFGQNKPLGSDIEGLDKGAPATARDSSGNIWAVWHAGPSGSRDIYLAKLTAGSSTFGAGAQITTDAADQCNPAVALGADDKLYVVWQDNRRRNWDIYGSTSTDGTAWSDQQRITDSNDNQINPALAVDSQSPNRAHVVWQDDRAGNQDIYIATSGNAFITNTITRITSNTSDQATPAIAVDSSNTVYVLWTDARNSSKDIYGAAGSSWTNIPVVTKAADQSSPAVAVESAGSILHILWVDQTSGDSDIYYASSSGLPSSPLTGSNTIDDTSGADQTSPSIAVTGRTPGSPRVFACWLDRRNITGGNTDTDIYLVQTNSGHGTNVLVGDGGTNSAQSEPAMGIDRYDCPYIVWTDGRNTNREIYHAASTYLQPTALTSKQITASAGGTIGTDPNAINGEDDVSVAAPAGACPYDVTISITKIENPQEFAARQLSSYDFGPSGMEFNRPVTVTIPYTVASSGTSPSAYWYDSLTGALSQQGITDIEIIELSSTLHALRFKTTHFTPFYVVFATGATAGAAGGGGGGGGGGCSMSPTGRDNVVEFLVPYLGLAVVIAVLKLRDARQRGARRILKGQC